MNSHSAVVPFFLLLLALPMGACGPLNSKQLAKFPSGKGRLEVDVGGFRSDEGEALFYLYPGPAGFPDQEGPGILLLKGKILQGGARVVIENLPYARYAVSVLHDENRNGRMDRSLFGLPREGFGFSRNPTSQFGPPTYQEASFILARPVQRQTIRMNYETFRKKRRQKLKAANRLG